MRTPRTIIEAFTKMVSENQPITSEYWMQAALYLNVLIGQEQATLFELEQAYTKVAMEWIEKGDSNAVAEKKAKLSPAFLDYKKQQAFVKQIEEFVRLAKKNATINNEQGA